MEKISGITLLAVYGTPIGAMKTFWLIKVFFFFVQNKRNANQTYLCKNLCVSHRQNYYFGCNCYSCIVVIVIVVIAIVV